MSSGEDSITNLSETNNERPIISRARIMRTHSGSSLVSMSSQTHRRASVSELSHHGSVGKNETHIVDHRDEPHTSPYNDHSGHSNASPDSMSLVDQYIAKPTPSAFTHAGHYSTQIIVAACKDNVEPWKPLRNVPSRSFSVRPLLGGMTNELFLCTAPEAYYDKIAPEHRGVVVRILSPEMEDMFDRSAELEVMKHVSCHTDIAPALLGHASAEELKPLAPSIASTTTLPSSALRFEQYISGGSLDRTQLKQNWARESMAEALAQLHALQIPGISRVPVVDRLLHIYADMSGVSFQQAIDPNAWKSLSSPLEQLLQRFDWNSEIQWTLNIARKYGGPIVFCHNDAQEGNWVYSHAAMKTLETRTGSSDSHSSTLDQTRNQQEASTSGDASAVSKQETSVCGKPVPDTSSKQETDTNSEQETIQNVSPSSTTTTTNNTVTQKTPQQINSNNLKPTIESPEPKQIGLFYPAQSPGRALYLIDYEYAGYNYRGFDLANGFCEHQLDYTVAETPCFRVLHDEFPSVAYQQAFLRTYAKSYKTAFAEQQLHIALDSRTNSPTSFAEPVSPADPLMCNKIIRKPKVEELMSEAAAMVPASHLLWSIWGLMMHLTKYGTTYPPPMVADTTDTEEEGYFDYVHNGLARAQLYEESKANVLKDPRFQQ